MNILQQPAFDVDLNLASAWCNWFVGWVDGEGCFAGSIDTRNKGIAAKLSVKVRDDDSPLVYNVKDTLQCGTIFKSKCSLGSKYHSKPQIIWRCESIGACRHILVPLFDRYPLQSKKSRDYDVWRQLVIAISDGQHVNGNRDYVLSLCQQLKDIKKYVSPTL